MYRCVSSTPAGSIEAQARVQVLGELACLGRGAMGRGCGDGRGLSPCLNSSSSPPSPTQRNSSSRPRRSHSSAWSLIRRPQCPAQPLAERSPQLSGYGQVGTMWHRLRQAACQMCVSKGQGSTQPAPEIVGGPRNVGLIDSPVERGRL